MYEVVVVTQNVAFNLGTDQKYEIKRWMISMGGKAVSVHHHSLGSIPLLFDDEAPARDLALALNAARAAKEKPA